jgi:methylated-DNA-[protein]-cysteine S-methyltransferase
MISAKPLDSLVVFPSSLGWMAAIGCQQGLKALAFGQSTPKAAIEALGPEWIEGARQGQWNPALVRRLQAFASGTPDDFHDIEVDSGPQTTFQQRVLRYCREIPLGETLTYAQLAAKAGSPNAARAVGNCMARNRIPLVIPCHRVVGSDGRLHGFSATGGLSMKQRLLDLEQSMVPLVCGRQ